MSRLIHLFSLLYPRAWRARYGVEYAALLEDVRPDARTAVDVLSGALTMQMRTWKSWKIVAASAVVGAMVIAGLYFEMPTRYVSSAIIRVDGQGSPQGTIDRINTLAETLESRGKLTQIITSYNLYLHERATVPLDDVIEEMRRNIQIKPLGGPNVSAFRIAFSYNEPRQAQKVTQDLAARFLDEDYRHAATGPVDGPKSGTTLQILDSANLPMTPIYPNKPLIVGVGIACFLVMWGGLSAWRTVSARRFAAAGGSVPSDPPGGSAPVPTLPPVREHLRRNAWKILFALVLLAGVVTFAYNLAYPKLYESNAVIRIDSATGPNPLDGMGYLLSLTASVESRSSLTRIIDDQNLYSRERQRMPLEDVIEKMKKSIRLEPLGSTAGVVRIGFVDTDARVAQQATQALVSRFVEESSVASAPIAITVIDQANLPQPRLPGVEAPSFVAGLIFGGLLGVLLAVLFRLFRRTPVPA